MNVECFQNFLQQSQYNPEKSKYLIDGFKNGFSISYEGDENVKINSPNLKFRQVGNKTMLWNKVMKEVELKRFAGPFKQIPFKNYIQSPISLVPKGEDGKDARLIFHLSYPRGRGISVNQNTPPGKCKVIYPDFAKAIQLCLRAGKNCKIGKSDMRSTFRNLGILRLHWKYLVMKAESPIDGETYYFVDKCLPFGASISCAHFQEFSDDVAHIVRWRTQQDLVNYLDGYLFVALLKSWCDAQLQTFLDMCKEIWFLVSEEKMFWSDSVITFLGMLINSVNQIVSIPVEKIAKGKTLIENVLSKKKLTLNQLQKICGFLNFLCRVVIPGRAFTRRLYRYTSGSHKLKPHHHLRINGEMRDDLRMWLRFLNDPSAYCRGFMDFDKTWNAEEIKMFSDASKNPKLGFGSICDRLWTFSQWDSDFITEHNPSIEYLELFGVLVSVINWLHHFKNQRIILFCNNQSMVSMINSTTSSCKNCLVLIQLLVFHSLKHNVRVFACYITSKANKPADFLSRLKIKTS